jgi:hypothetical protein
MSADRIHAWLDAAIAQGHLRALDRAFALFLRSLDAAADDRVIAAGALASFELGNGHIGVDVEDLLGDNPKAFLKLQAAERYARFFEHFVDALRERPLTIEILAAELVERNELAAVLESERERWGEEASRLLAAKEFSRRPELQGLTLLLIAGVQYLLLRSRKIRIFGGVDITSDAGWAELKAAIRKTAISVVG